MFPRNILNRERETQMTKLLGLLAIAITLSACVKEEVTNNYITNPVPVEPLNNNQQTVEGTINGGGGKGVLCKRDGIETVETLDLYEAKVLYGLEELDANVSSQAEAITLISRVLARHNWNPSSISMSDFEKFYQEYLTGFFSSRLRFISNGKKLKLVADSAEAIVEDNCEMVQVAVYYDESVILVDKTLWEKMSWIHRTALLTHELVYAQDRQNGAKNSIKARRLTGQLFSKKGARPRADGVPTENERVAFCNL